MIRNGVIDAQKEFAERRYLAEATRNFDRIKADAKERFGIDIEMCRTAYVRAGERLFALVGDVLVDSYSKPHLIEPWEQAKKRIHGANTERNQP